MAPRRMPTVQLSCSYTPPCIYSFRRTISSDDTRPPTLRTPRRPGAAAFSYCCRLGSCFLFGSTTSLNCGHVVVIVRRYDTPGDLINTGGGIAYGVRVHIRVSGTSKIRIWLKLNAHGNICNAVALDRGERRE